MTHFNWKSGVSVVIAFAAVACGGAPPPTARSAAAEAAVKNAEPVAGSVPEAQAKLDIARKELSTGRSLMADGDNERAEAVLYRAEADADLSKSIAKRAQAEAEAQKAKQDVERARAELAKGKQP